MASTSRSDQSAAAVGESFTRRELRKACESLPSSLREFADALDADRRHGKSYVTLLMREAAVEIERLRDA